jgi:hypothetical protein
MWFLSANLALLDALENAKANNCTSGIGGA